jgi:hypothetical protein
MDNTDNLWLTLLSGNTSLIQEAWADLTDEEARAIGDHLRQMVSEEGYSEEQKEAALKALEAIRRAG